MLKRALKIRRILGATLLAQFIMLNGLLQLHNSVHPSEHGRHIAVDVGHCCAPTGPAESYEVAGPQNSHHSLCVICYLCAANQALPVAGILTPHGAAARSLLAAPFELPTLNSPDTASGRSPPAAA